MTLVQQTRLQPQEPRMSGVYLDKGRRQYQARSVDKRLLAIHINGPGAHWIRLRGQVKRHRNFLEA